MSAQSALPKHAVLSVVDHLRCAYVDRGAGVVLLDSGARLTLPKGLSEPILDRINAVSFAGRFGYRTRIKLTMEIDVV